MCGRETASGRIEKSAFWAPVPKQKVSVVEREGPGWTVSLDRQGDADCPICGTRSSSRYGSYIRSLQDLPAQGRPVLIQARVTRWRCLNDQCERRTFAEPRLDLTAPFAGRTRCASRSAAILYGSVLHAMSLSVVRQRWRRTGRHSNAAFGVSHAILTPRIRTGFMARNMAPRSGTWRAFHIVRHDNTP
jgi:transposase